MQRETEQMAAVADARQGSMRSGVSFSTQLASLAVQANNRLANALEAEAEVARQKSAALLEQREVMRALIAVNPQHEEVKRGETLDRRAVGR